MNFPNPFWTHLCFWLSQPPVKGYSNLILCRITSTLFCCKVAAGHFYSVSVIRKSEHFSLPSLSSSLRHSQFYIPLSTLNHLFSNLKWLFSLSLHRLNSTSFINLVFFFESSSIAAFSDKMIRTVCSYQDMGASQIYSIAE